MTPPTPQERQRLTDIVTACEAIAAHVERGGLSDGLVFDACRMRLVEIGEAVKALSPELRAQEPGIPWRQVARMRDHLAHRYFDTVHAIVDETIRTGLPDLEAAVRRLLDEAD